MKLKCKVCILFGILLPFLGGCQSQNKKEKVNKADSQYFKTAEVKNQFEIDTLKSYRIIYSNCLIYLLNNNMDSFILNDEYSDSSAFICNGYLEEVNSIYIESKDSIKVFMSIKIGLNQSLTDDTEGVFLNFTYDVPEIELSPSNKIYKIPSISEVTKNGQLTFKEYFEQNYWNEIFEDSYQIQKEFYTKLLSITKYPEEYRIQAKKFLSKDKKSFMNFQELNIDPKPILKEVEINIKSLKSKKNRKILLTY